MPRRPSGTVGPSQGSSTSLTTAPRTQKPGESSTTLITSHTTPTASHQPSQITMEINGNRYQKVVTVLANRLKNQLPCISGHTLDAVEADAVVQEAIDALTDLSHDALPVIAWTLGNILDTLSKQVDEHGQFSLETLQSQLFVLKVLSVNLASRLAPGLRSPTQPATTASSYLAPNSPILGSFHQRRRQASSEYSEIASLPSEIPPLEERCARYVLSIILIFLRQTAPAEAPLILPSKTSDITFRDFETEPAVQQELPSDHTEHVNLPQQPQLRTQASSGSVLSGNTSVNSTIRIPAAQMKYEKTHMSLVKSRTAVTALIAEFSGRIIFSISVSNWSTVFERLRSKIRALANKPDETSDLTDLQLLGYIIFDRPRLVQVLNELSSLLVNMGREAQLAIATPLRSAVWNWIEYHPREFNEIIRTRTKTEGAPERVFDLLTSKFRSGDERVVWPSLTALCCMISERLATDHIQYSGNTHRVSRKDLRFLHDLLKVTSTPGVLRYSDVALVCSIDLCRGATFAAVGEDEEVPLRLLAIDVAHEIKAALNQIAQKIPGRQSVWEVEEIDVVLYANALVTVYRFLPPEESLSLIKEWMEPTRSDAVKICAVRACLTLAQEASRFPWQRPLEPLREAMAKRCREVFKTLGHRRPELDQWGAMKRPDAYPKAKRAVSEALTDRELLMLGILSLWRVDPAFHTTSASSADLEEWVAVVVKIWEAPVDNSVKVSTTTCLCHLAMNTFRATPSAPHFPLMSKLIKSSLPATLLSVSVHLLRAREDIELQHLWVALALQVLELYIVRIEGQHVKEIQLDADRVPAFVMAEIAFTVTLTSSNNIISQMAAKGLRNLAIIQRQPDAPQIDFLSAEDYAKRARVYDQLGDPKVAVVGRVGHQKRIRKHLRLLAPCPAIDVMVWNECHKRWKMLTEPALDMVRDPGRPFRVSAGPNWKTQDLKFQWHNLSLYLAAFGGICLENTREARNKLISIIPYKYLPDELMGMEDIYTYLGPFLSDLNKILTVPDVATRDIARDALGAELHPGLYSRVLKTLDETTRAHENEGYSHLSDEYLLFLEQFIAILKLILENERYLEEKMTFDISSILMSLTSMISRCVGSQTFRLRMKFCSLCDSISMRTDTFILRKESPTRQNIIELLMEWIDATVSEAGRDGQLDDFNTACLKTLVKLLDKFQLRFADTLNAGDDTIHVVSREFNKYSQTLLHFLEVYQPVYTDFDSDNESEYVNVERLQGGSQREIEIRELVTTGLANLVSANSEIGFKQCLPLAYDQDKRKRIIFAHVFARVIGQGTTFVAEERTTAQSRNARLNELVRGSKLALALTIVEVCPFSEDDMMIFVLLNIFDTRATLMSFLKALIDSEIAQADSEASLFRRNSVGNKLLSAFAKIHGYNYLRNLIGPLVEFMGEFPPGHSYEMDPNKAKEQDLVENQRTVEYAATKFLSLMTSSLPQLPPMLREVSAYISARVSEIWPTSKFAVMGAFLFLRFITPAVVAPENVDIELPTENRATMRRGLMVVGKILQNLANNIFFGKEAHMTVLNKFLEGQIANVTRFLSEIHKSPPSTLESDDLWQGTIGDDTDTIVLHRFLDRHADKIGKELLSMSRPTPEGDPSALNGKRAWDELCALLVDLGSPVATPQLSCHASQESREYGDLMTRYAEQSIAPVQGFFVEAPPNDRDMTIFVLRLSKLDVEAIDIELLMYYILRVLGNPKRQGKHFDVIVDCTGFTPMSELPLQWLRFCAEIVPKDIRENFMTAHILNPNSLAQKYLRRLYNFMAGTPLCSSVKTYVSITQLLEALPPTVTQVLPEAYALEQEQYEEFSEVTWKQSTSMRVPVILRVATSHIRITSRQRQPVSPVLACRNVEIIYLADIGDIYNIFTGQDLNEFIVRRRQGSTTYFFSSLRDPIVRAIRHAKGKLKDIQVLMSERFSRFSNVPATLLHVGFLSVDFEDETMRGASYHLLGAVCAYLKYDKSPIIATEAGVIPGDPIAFVNQMSEKLADYAPQLTLDFIHEVSASLKSMGKDSLARRSSCLHYMSPWIKNLAHFVNPTHSLYERSGARLRDCIRTLAELSVVFPDIIPSLQRCIWAEISKSDNAIIDAVLDELIRTAADGGINNPRCETISHIVATITSISVRGRVYHKLRKALNRPPNQPANNVSEHANYSEISTLVKLCLVVGSQSRQLAQNQLYVPEIIHIVMLVAADGPLQVRKSVYGIVLNLLQSLYVVRTEDMPGTELLQIIKDYTSAETLQLFGLERHVRTSKHTLWVPQGERQYLDNLENLATFLARVMQIASGSKGLLNIWRARWMSLVTSTAFQNIPAVQTRSFIALATLANQDVDDDFLYQILVAFRAALVQADENHSSTVVSMLRCICRIIPILQRNSRYLASIFWLAVSLLQSSYSAFYIEATILLRVSLEAMEEHGMFEEGPVHQILLDSRSPLEEITGQLDHLLKFSFESSFSFTLAAIIFKGMRVRGFKEYAEAALMTLLRVTVRAERTPDVTNGFKNSPSQSVLGYFLALLPGATTPESYRKLLRECDIGDAWHADAGLPEVDHQTHVPTVTHNFVGVNDPKTALFVATFAGTMLSTSQGDDAETEMLYSLLADLGNPYPETVSLVFGNLQDKIISAFHSSSNPVILRCVSIIYRISQPEFPNFTNHDNISTSTLNTAEDSSATPALLNALEAYRMQGLAQTLQFLPPHHGYATKMIKWIPGLVDLMI